MHRSVIGLALGTFLIVSPLAAPAAAQAPGPDKRITIGVGPSWLKVPNLTASGIAVDVGFPVYATDALVLSGVGGVALDRFEFVDNLTFSGVARVSSAPRGRASVFGQSGFGRTRVSFDTNLGCNPRIANCTYSVRAWTVGGGVNIAMTERVRARIEVDYLKYRTSAEGATRYWFGVELPIGQR